MISDSDVLSASDETVFVNVREMIHTRLAQHANALDQAAALTAEASAELGEELDAEAEAEVSADALDTVFHQRRLLATTAAGAEKQELACGCSFQPL